MTDIDVCPGTDCPLAATCWRAKNYNNDKFAMTPLYKDGDCVMYSQVEFYGQ